MDDKIPDINSMERLSLKLSKLLKNKEFDSEEDLKRFLNSIDLNKDLPDIPEKTTADLAQDIIYDAWEAKSRKERIKLAKKALFLFLLIVLMHITCWLRRKQEPSKRQKNIMERVLKPEGVSWERKCLKKIMVISGDIFLQDPICVLEPDLWSACGSWEIMMRQLAMHIKCSDLMLAIIRE